jgi:hypothetical protein
MAVSNNQLYFKGRRDTFTFEISTPLVEQLDVELQTEKTKKPSKVKKRRIEDFIQRQMYNAIMGNLVPPEIHKLPGYRESITNFELTLNKRCAEDFIEWAEDNAINVDEFVQHYIGLSLI